ncbi:zinc-ribbon domain-containing protein [Blastopirellula sp. J2-11]|uniref:zinc-ribbon domain-containing protein n=1 Tax=Blastopirellula sp. J2-11 TaxID=2943192 RepID=UPI0021C99C20|nr:zinc-ribbon domain-containing protein [Blastopirellula sp. J2-11]UUO05118.1 zinc-ribbon domain-containing protein [Blastopirellula sp. J2-11]
MNKIRVTCPHCLKRYDVSDKFAGKEGPCPNCKKTIRVPTLDEQVVIHEKEQFGGVKDTAGRLVFEPIKREDAKFSPVALAIVLVSAILVLGIAFLMRGMDDAAKTPILVIGSLALAFPVVYGAYWFTRNDELEAFHGSELWIRVSLCAVAFAAIWGLYALVIPFARISPDEFPVLLMWVSICLAAGSCAAMGCFEVDFILGFMIYATYLLITATLRMAMALQPHYPHWWIW